MAKKEIGLPTAQEMKANKDGNAIVAKLAEDIKTAEEMYGDGMPYEIERIENQIRFFQNQAGSALLEMGKCLIRIKAHEEHGRFMHSLEVLGLSYRNAAYAMSAARKFSNVNLNSHLGDTKLKILSVLDEEDIEKLENGSDVNGLTLDKIDKMTCAELRKEVRKKTKELEHQKEVQEAAIAQKEAKINELDQRLRYQQPPTKEQIALAELQKHTEDYTLTCAKINMGIRKALNILDAACKIPNINVQQLSDWIGIFEIEMRNFHDLNEAWMGALDNACPVEVGKIMEADVADVPSLG